jgi:hypothetical protein
MVDFVSTVGLREASSSIAAGFRTCTRRLAAGGLVGLALCASLAACGRQEADDPAKEPSVNRMTQAVEADSQVIVRQGSQGYEIEVRGQQALIPLGNDDPVLRVGDALFVLYKNSPVVKERGAIFSLTAEQFASLPDGASVVVSFGPTKPGKIYGTLNKSAVGVQP